MAEQNMHIPWEGWKCVKLIGKGGYGTVYEIQRVQHGITEKAAMKKISVPQSADEVDNLRIEGYDDESITQRFSGFADEIIREYGMMIQMKGNANIVYCDDYKIIQQADGFGQDIYIKMELLTPLVKALDQVATEAQIIRFGMDMCSGLEVCRRRKVIHRDIKPQNIFVSEDGVFKLGDFSIARTAEKTTRATVGIGTYQFMAPEVMNNQPYGSTVDIYSLGLVMYWLLNGRRSPFLPLPPAVPKHGEEEQARQRRFGGEQIPAPRDGSEGLKRIVLKACAFDPKDRYQSAREMREDLQRLSGCTIPVAVSQTVAVPEVVQTLEMREEDKTVGPNFTPKKPDLVKRDKSVRSQVSVNSVGKNNMDCSTERNVIAQTKQSKKLAMLLVAIFLLLITGYFTNIGAKEESVKVPNVQYQDKIDAKAKLDTLGLKVTITEVESETVAEGQVISQSIAANTTADPGTSIILTVSKGAGSFAMPNVVGMTEENAKSTLTEKGLSVSAIYEYSTTAEGIVLMQSISADTQVTRGTVVTITVSSGQEMVTVPNIVGQESIAAQKMLKNEGFVVTVNMEYSNTVEEGNVINQTPAGGSTQVKGSTVIITVSLGKDAVKSITVATKPNRTSYFVGETLNPAGLMLTVTYRSGAVQTVSGGYTCSPTALNTVGSQTITVTYEGKTASFMVDVYEIVLISVSLKSGPSKTSYWVGDTLDTTGLVLTAKYSDGSTKDVASGFTCTPTRLSVAGYQTITVNYYGKTVAFTVYVYVDDCTETPGMPAGRPDGGTIVPDSTDGSSYEIQERTPCVFW